MEFNYHKAKVKEIDLNCYFVPFFRAYQNDFIFHYLICSQKVSVGGRFLLHSHFVRILASLYPRIRHFFYCDWFLKSR